MVVRRAMEKELPIAFIVEDMELTNATSAGFYLLRWKTMAQGDGNEVGSGPSRCLYTPYGSYLSTC